MSTVCIRAPPLVLPGLTQAAGCLRFDNPLPTRVTFKVLGLLCDEVQANSNSVRHLLEIHNVHRHHSRDLPIGLDLVVLSSAFAFQEHCAKRSTAEVPSRPLAPAAKPNS